MGCVGRELGWTWSGLEFCAADGLGWCCHGLSCLSAALSMVWAGRDLGWTDHGLDRQWAGLSMVWIGHGLYDHVLARPRAMQVMGCPWIGLAMGCAAYDLGWPWPGLSMGCFCRILGWWWRVPALG
jgi:hypothetical protein